MKKKVFGRHFSRSSSSRRGLFRSLVRAVVINGAIKTTPAKAKAVMPFFDKLMTEAKKATVASRRNVLAKLGNDKLITGKIFDLALIFKEQRGGYLKITPLPARVGDNALMMRLELTKKIEPVVVKKPEKKAGNKAAESKAESKKSLGEKVKSVISRRKNN
ncbi:MAG TPA: 50S ribosomal protein L17 [Patescibacteria group bacterium]|nr:50S ribosomal protein L17 [Patescibacteria group bacterium]